MLLNKSWIVLFRELFFLSLRYKLMYATCFARSARSFTCVRIQIRTCGKRVHRLGCFCVTNNVYIIVLVDAVAAVVIVILVAALYVLARVDVAAKGTTASHRKRASRSSCSYIYVFLCVYRITTIARGHSRLPIPGLVGYTSISFIFALTADPLSSLSLIFFCLFAIELYHSINKASVIYQKDQCPLYAIVTLGTEE